MRKRWHFTFRGRGYKHFHVDSSQVRCTHPIEAIRTGWITIDRVGDPKVTRFINMDVVAFIDIVEHPDQPGLAVATPDETI